MYSPADGRFLPDRYVEGTCPHCGYDKARGDQCENCTRVLDPTDLINPRSAISGSTELEVRETKHLFLLQSKLQHEVEEWVARHEEEWPQLASSIARKWLTEGLHDRAITRDLDWGVPVPADTWPELAAEGKVFYVWFDAPIEYIGATKEWADTGPGEPRLEVLVVRGRPGENPVRYTEFMAKDNVPFHTVMFPATELGVREPWKKVDYVKAFNWLTYYGGKFSTSQKRGVFTDQALDILPADYWRYFLIANAPESDDSSFTWEHFTATVNKDLADTLGNFVNRVLSFSKKRFGEEVPAGARGRARPRRSWARRSPACSPSTRPRWRPSSSARPRPRCAPCGRAGNSYLEEKAPWLEIKTNPEGAALTLRTAMNLIHLYSVVSEPFIPASAKAMRSAFALRGRHGDLGDRGRGEVPGLPPRRHPLHGPPGPLRQDHGRGPGVVQGALRRRPE